MASPLSSSKPTVDLATPMPRVSRIRRDPPPPEKVVTAAEIKEQEGWAMAIGILVLALAAFVVMIAFGNAEGWSPRQYTVEWKS